MKKNLTIIFLTTIFVLATSIVALAQDATFNATRTFLFDPDNNGGVSADWIDGIGERDFNGRTNFGLRLEKVDAPDAAGVILRGLRNVEIQAGDLLGFDYLIGTPCTGGSPRFNVDYRLPDGSPAFSFVGGCGNDNEQTPASTPGWNRVRFDLQDPGEAFPVIPVGSTIDDISLVVDELGQYNVDNIRFRTEVADRPGRSNTVSPSY